MTSMRKLSPWNLRAFDFHWALQRGLLSIKSQGSLGFPWTDCHPTGAPGAAGSFPDAAGALPPEGFQGYAEARTTQVRPPQLVLCRPVNLSLPNSPRIVDLWPGSMNFEGGLLCN